MPILFPNRLLVIAISATRVEAGIFRAVRRGRLALQLHAIEPIERIGEAGGEPDRDWLPGALRSLQILTKRHGLHGPCRLALPGEATLLRSVRTPATGSRTMDCAIGFEASLCIPLPLDRVNWDHIPVQVADGYCEALVAAMRSDAASALCAGVRAAGLMPVAIEPAAFSLLQACRYRRLGTGGALVASVGARSTHLVYVAGEHFRLRTVGMGTDEVAQGIAGSLGIRFAEAERLAWNRDGSRDRPGAVVDAVELLASRVRCEIARFNTASPSVHLTGPAARLPGLEEALGRTIEVIRFEPTDKPMVSGVLLGLATILVDEDRPSLNLLPPREARAVRMGRMRPAIVAAALILLAVAVPEASRPSAVVARAAEPRRIADTHPAPEVTEDSVEEPEPIPAAAPVEVRPVVIPIQLRGVAGGGTAFVGIFVNAATGEMATARPGERIGRSGFELVRFEASGSPAIRPPHAIVRNCVTGAESSLGLSE